MEVNEVLEKLGLFGRWQVTYFTAIMFTFMIPGCWHIFNIIWIGYKPPHHCTLPSNETSVDDWIPTNSNGKLSSCSMYSNKDNRNHTTSCLYGYTYDETFSGPTFASKWDLVCDRGYLVDTTQTVMAVGVLMGSLIFTRISDHFGRKPIIILIQALMNVTGALTVLCERIEWYFVLRFFEGVFQQGVISCNVVQLCEMFSTKHRALVAITASGVWAVAECFLPLIAYSVKNWVYFQLFISLYGFIFIPIYWWLPETIPWLHANNRVNEAEKILMRAAKMNSITLSRPILKPYNDHHTLQESCLHNNTELANDIEEYSEEDGMINKNNNIDHSNTNIDNNNNNSLNNDQVKTITYNLEEGRGKCLMNRLRLLFQKKNAPSSEIQYSAMELIKNKRLLSFLIICISFGMVDNLVYYGLILSTNTLSSNHYINGFISALIEIPGCVIVYLSVNKFGRKKPMAVSHALAGAALLACVLVDTLLDDKYKSILVPALSITGKCWISGAFAIDIFYVVELFPTNLRNQAFGVCIFFSRIGNVMASYASYIIENYPNLLPLVFGILSMLVALLIVFLPETSGRALPETIEEIESWYKKPKSKNDSKDLQI